MTPAKALPQGERDKRCHCDDRSRGIVAELPQGSLDYFRRHSSTQSWLTENYISRLEAYISTHC